MTTIQLTSNVPSVNRNIRMESQGSDILPGVTRLDLKTFFKMPTDDENIHNQLKNDKVWVCVDIDLFKAQPTSVKHEYRLYLGQGGASVINRQSGEEFKLHRIEGGQSLSGRLSTILKDHRVKTASEWGICIGVIGLVGVLFHQMKLAKSSGMASLLKVSNWKGGVGVVGFGLVTAISTYVWSKLPEWRSMLRYGYLQRVVGIAVQIHKNCTEGTTTPITLSSRTFTWAPVN